MTQPNYERLIRSFLKDGHSPESLKHIPFLKQKLSPEDLSEIINSIQNNLPVPIKEEPEVPKIKKTNWRKYPTIKVRISNELQESISKLSEQNNITPSEIVRTALIKYFGEIE